MGRPQCTNSPHINITRIVASTVTQLQNNNALIRTFRRRSDEHFTARHVAIRQLVAIFRRQHLPSRSPTRMLRTTHKIATTTILDSRLNYRTIPYLRTMLATCQRVELVRGLQSRTYTIPGTAIKLLDTLPTIAITLNRLLKTEPLTFLLKSPHNIIYLMLKKYYCTTNLT